MSCHWDENENIIVITSSLCVTNDVCIWELISLIELGNIIDNPTVIIGMPEGAYEFEYSLGCWSAKNTDQTFYFLGGHTKFYRWLVTNEEVIKFISIRNW